MTQTMISSYPAAPIAPARHPLRRAVCSGWLTVLLALSACGGSGGSGGAQYSDDDQSDGWVEGEFLPASQFAQSCANPRSGANYPDSQGSRLDENNWVRSWINNTYLWYDEVTDRNPALYDDTERYFNLLRTTEKTASGRDKDQFRFSMSTEEYQARAQSGLSVGYGISWSFRASQPPRDIRVVFVEPDSPAAQAGVRRGHRLVEVDGVDVIDGDDVETINAGSLPEESGEEHQLVFSREGQDDPLSATLEAQTITSAPVPVTETFDSASGRVGYILFNDHNGISEQALVAAVESLKGEIVDLVLDLRYNSGGYLAIASQLSYMVAGNQATDGKVFEALRFNDKHPNINPVTGQPLSSTPFWSQTLGFSELPEGEPLPRLHLDRVFVLTGSNTCSASESIINGLRGVDVEVIQIGGATCGKPYGYYPQDNCGTTYAMIQFQGENDKGFGDYGDGFAPEDASTTGAVPLPGCEAADDLSRALGDPQEKRLAAALEYRDSGTCSVPAAGILSLDAAPAPRTDGLVPKSPVLQNKIMRGEQ